MSGAMRYSRRVIPWSMGRFVLGETPGIGLIFDEDRLRAHAVQAPSPRTLGSGYRRSPDLRARRARRLMEFGVAGPN